jgi:uncharacterized protein YjbI with pentapeptide repeats
MAKRQRSATLNRLAGKRLVFSGKFAYGVEDSLKAMAEAQQGAVCDDLSDKVDYLVLADLSGGKTIQKKVVARNAKGAAIQVIDVDGFKNLAEPTEDEVLALLRAGESEVYAKICGSGYHRFGRQSPKHTFVSEDFSEVTFQNASLDGIHFDGCCFSGARFERVGIEAAPDCDFSKATGHASRFGDVQRCRFNQATLNGCHFTGDCSGADFTDALLENASFIKTVYYGHGVTGQTATAGVLFTRANLKSAKLRELHLTSPDFRGADLTKAEFQNCAIDSGSFCNAGLREALLVGCKLSGADLSNADLTGANLAGADLTGAALAGANLQNANLRGAKLEGVDLSKVKNYDPGGAVGGAVGPALTELDQLCATAKRILVAFRVGSSEGENPEQVQIDRSHLQWGWGVQVPQSIGPRLILRHGSPLTFSDAMLRVANVAGHMRVCFETVDVSSTKSPTGGKELRDLVMRGIAEAFAQRIPPEEELAEATKKYRAAEREKGAAQRERREQAKAQAAKEKEKAKKQIARKIEKTVGKVSDVASFLKALEVRIEKPKIDKATKMLKASGFKLFNDVTDEYLSGVVKSQTDPDLVYACRVAHDGQYACCTQNLNVCGGLRGSICKHLLVLIIGLVQAGELDPTTIDAWIARTHSVKPELDKEIMGAIFIKYKGAEAGEVDWRPTETVPEDYYTL